ncbi:Nif3-like dinuclear metal center hexameric protein, partial [uncultured Subdoligranulum sp.]|uniref:Nif3-like dinuclear metal center hexameric protein n=1 Tax=uncultured Subdoligranulum sp. TaxID=512298 RepID=UPI00260C3808
ALGMPREGRRDFADGAGRIGTVPATTAAELARFCAGTLRSGVKYVDSPRPVTCLAEVSGAGGSYLQQAIDEGADCLVTGEAAHHIALLAKQKGVGLVVAGPWGSEQGGPAARPTRLAPPSPGRTAAHAAADTDPYAYLGPQG